MRKIVFSATLLVLMLGFAAMAADVSGTWAVKMKGPMGDEDFSMVVKVAGENLTIAANHPMLQDLAGTGTLKGDEIKFKLEATGQMPIAFEFTGKVSGNKMSGTREIKMGGGPGGGPGGEGGPGGGMDMSQISKNWTAEKK
jgi:hypothetical protein